MCGLYVIACIPPSGEKGAVPEAHHDPLDRFLRFNYQFSRTPYPETLNDVPRRALTEPHLAPHERGGMAAMHFCLIYGTCRGRLHAGVVQDPQWRPSR